MSMRPVGVPRSAAGRKGARRRSMSSQDLTGRTAEALVSPLRRAGGGDLGDVTRASGPEMPRAARAIVSDWLYGRASAGVVSDAQLLISELVTNSFLHAENPSGDRVRLRAGTSNGSIWFEVRDAGRDGA